MKSTWPVDIPGSLTIVTAELIHSYGTYFFMEVNLGLSYYMKNVG